MKQPRNRTMTISYYFIVILILLTPTLLIWQYFGMTRILELSPSQAYRVSANSDRERGEGDSISSLVRTAEGFIMRCQLGRGTYPYCKLQFLIGDARHGVDLSRYDTIVLNIRVLGTPRPLVKLHLVNFEPDISTVGDWYSQRYNQAELNVTADQPSITIPLNAVRTAEWWQTQRMMPLSRTYTRLDNVTAVEVATGNFEPGKLLTVELRSIQFRGKWISQSSLLMFLMAAWIGCGIFGLLNMQARSAELLAEAVGLARDRSNFLAQMSHELRTPLNAIMGYTQLLQRNKQHLTEQEVAGLATIQESSQHLLTLINDILDLARVEAGKMVLYPTSVNLEVFLRVVVDIMRVKAEEKGLLFSFELADELPAAVTVDETRLRQVLLNLLGNAVKFTDVGTVTLRVSPARPANTIPDQGGAASTRIRFEVADSGIGMSEQQRAKLFQPFEQVADMARREGGTGLGLAISQQLVHLMGGSIAVVSEPGKGSRFWFELAVPVATATVPVPPMQRAINGYAGERRRLLIVDDVPQNRAMLMDLLQSLGFVVASAGNGRECLALLDSFMPDLIVMDVMMPEMGGNEATRRIRQMPEWNKIPIIAASASASHEDELKCREAGVDAFLAKPVDHDVLLNVIGAQLALKWNTRQAPREPGNSDEEKGGDLVIPPAPEIEALWQLARLGNMSAIRKQADYLAALDPAYLPFAQHLRALAQGYHSKALLAFVERFRAESAVPPL
jgi:signal transduction histidine kinase/CheY-like chemotaxis protein